MPLSVDTKQNRLFARQGDRKTLNTYDDDDVLRNYEDAVVDRINDRKSREKAASGFFGDHVDERLDTHPVAVEAPARFLQFADEKGYIDARCVLSFQDDEKRVEFIELSAQTNEQLWVAFGGLGDNALQTVWVCRREIKRKFEFSQSGMTWILAACLVMICAMMAAIISPNMLFAIIVLSCGLGVVSAGLFVGLTTLTATSVRYSDWVAMSKQRWDAMVYRAARMQSQGVHFNEVRAWLDAKLYGGGSV